VSVEAKPRDRHVPLARLLWLPFVEYVNIFPELSRVQISADLERCVATFTIWHLSIEHAVTRVIFDHAVTAEIWQAPVRTAVMRLRGEREGSCVPVECGPVGV
jgi:hypothetical protein